MNPAAPAVVVEGLSFGYKSKLVDDHDLLFRDFSLKLMAGQFVALMGGSGSGKSTFAKLLAGTLTHEPAAITWRTDFTDRLSDIVYIDQAPMNAVFPWHSIRKNIMWPLESLGWEKTEIDSRTDELLELFGLQQLANSFPAHVSGGELQRLAVARSLSWKPKCLILDENFSMLDRRTKDVITHGLRQLSTRDQMTIVLITHNLSDAMALADRCIIIGQRPVQVLGDFSVPLAFPRNEESREYQEAQEPLIEILRHGHL